MKNEIMQSLDKATPGQWEVKTDKFFSNTKGIYSNGFYIGGGIREQDAELISNAPTWLRWQNERIEELEKALELYANGTIYSNDDGKAAAKALKGAPHEPRS